MDDATVLMALLSEIPVPDAARDDIHTRMSVPGRYYHGAGHLADLWRQHLAYCPGQVAGQAPWHRLIACAVGFHDLVYDPTRRDNEDRSATLWLAANPNCDTAEREWVRRTILATANHLAAAPEPDEPAEAWTARAWMLDLDFSPLGGPPSAFDANTVNLRAEYGHLDDTAWRTGRAGFLKGLRGKRLFRSPVLVAAFEAPAQANIERSLAELG